MMRILSWRALLPLMLMAVMFAAVACGSSSSNDSVDVPDDIDADQTLNVNLGAEPDTLDPQRATDTVSITVLSNIYSTLLRINPDLEIEAELAKEVPTVENGGISADGLTYTFHLRDGLKWSDGTELVAQSFVDGARRLFDPGSGNYYVDFYRVLAAPGADGTDANVETEKALGEGKEGAELEAIESKIGEQLAVEAPDSKTVVYHLNRQSPVFLLLASMWPLYPVRQDIIDAKGDQWTEAGTLVSNGPFSLGTWNHNEDIQLVRNEYWHGGKTPLTTINMDMIDDSAVSFLAYQNGELDVVALGPAELVQVRADPNLQKEFSQYAQLVTLGVYLKADDPVFKNEKARQAFSMGINREELAETVLEGAALPAYGWVPPGMPGYDPEVGVTMYKDKQADAKALLAEAGIAPGTEITILSSQSNTAVLIAEWLKEQWETNLGVKVKINSLETATYFAERNAGNWQVVSGGWGADYPDPQNWLPLFKTGAGLNAGNYSNAEFDALIDQADQELDNEKRLAQYKQAQEILINTGGFVPMYYRSRSVVVRPYVKGIVLSSMEGIAGDRFYDQVYIQGRE